MAVILQDAFKSPVVGTDPITKGTFTIVWAHMLLDYEDEDLKNVRASGNVVIDGWNNPLFDAIKANPLRAQHLIGSVIFGTEKMFVRFEHLSDYSMVDDDIVKEIEFTLVFEILNNLEYLENVAEYKNENLL